MGSEFQKPESTNSLFYLKGQSKGNNRCFLKFFVRYVPNREYNICKTLLYSVRSKQLATLFQTIFQLVTQSLEERNVELAGQQLADFCR
jgi:hypothetical protein